MDIYILYNIFCNKKKKINLMKKNKYNEWKIND